MFKKLYFKTFNISGFCAIYINYLRMAATEVEAPTLQSHLSETRVFSYRCLSWTERTDRFVCNCCSLPSFGRKLIKYVWWSDQLPHPSVYPSVRLAGCLEICQKSHCIVVKINIETEIGNHWEEGSSRVIRHKANHHIGSFKNDAISKVALDICMYSYIHILNVVNVQGLGYLKDPVELKEPGHRCQEAICCLFTMVDNDYLAIE